MSGFDRKYNGKNSDYRPGQLLSANSNPRARVRMMNEMVNANWKNRGF
tara:strand:- start:11 stop:154 length:144 start_codon:yes stop_codon:yes gene_type:complete